MLSILMLMALQGNSQNTFEKDVKVLTENNDSLIQIYLNDARDIILRDLKDYKILDSLYKKSLIQNKVYLKVLRDQMKVTDDLKTKNFNNETKIHNLELVIEGDSIMNSNNQETIKKQGREIRKQKFLKVVGFVAAVALPVAVLFLTKGQ